MITPPAALVDLDRLTEVARYQLNDPQLREQLDAITARTSTRLGLPVSLVSVLLDSANMFSGATGMPDTMSGLPAEWSFCTQVVATGRPYLVPDATTDPDWAGNPAVTVYGARSYAGVPLTAPNGHILGAHCAIGTEPHTFTTEDLAELRTAAADIVALLQQHRTH